MGVPNLFKIIREIRKTSAIKIQRYWRKKLPGILHFKRYISGVHQAAATVQKYLRGFLVGKHSLKVRRNIKLKCLEAYFAEKRREMQLDSQIKIRYKARKLRERQEEQMRIYEEERLQQLERDRQQVELFRRQERVGSEVPQGIAEIVMMQGDINILNVQHTFRSTQIANASQVGPSTFRSSCNCKRWRGHLSLVETGDPIILPLSGWASMLPLEALCSGHFPQIADSFYNGQLVGKLQSESETPAGIETLIQNEQIRCYFVRSH